MDLWDEDSLTRRDVKRWMMEDDITKLIRDAKVNKKLVEKIVCKIVAVKQKRQNDEPRQYQAKYQKWLPMTIFCQDDLLP